MKKLATIIIALFALSFASKAQFYVGGTAGFGLSATNGASFNYTISPEAGYGLNDKMAVGASLDFAGTTASSSGNGSSAFTFMFSPYFRYKFASIGDVDFVVDGVVNIGSHSNSYWTSSNSRNTSNYFRWGVGARPAITYTFLPRWTFVTKLGNLGIIGTNGSVVFNLSALTSVGIGVYYSF